MPVCETIPGRNHFDVLESLVDPAGRLHELTLRLMGFALSIVNRYGGH